MSYALRLTPYALLLTSCSLIAPPATIPSYIRVQSYTVKDTALLGQGTTSSNITDIWVDENSDFRGIYQLPVSVPILNSGPVTISLQAVVQEDGIVSNLLPYPFYTYYNTNVNLQPGKLDTIHPIFYYNSKTKFAWPGGDFETNNSVLKTFPPNNADCYITTSKDSVFEGLRSYAVNLSTGHDTFNVKSSLLFTPPASDIVWLEMNYKTDFPMDIGINLVNPANPSPPGPQEFISGVNPTTSWKKIYINVTSALQYFNQYPNFFIYFYATGSGNGHILIDNLKLLYLE